MRPNGAMPDAGDVLVVDDDPIIAELLATILSEEGYAVRTVTDGAAASAALADQVPAVLLIDLNMPGLPTGAIIQMTRRWYANLPIGIITDSPEWAVPFLGDTWVTCIAKPFDLSVLLAWVGQYLTPQRAVSAGVNERPRTRANGRRRHEAVVARVVWRLCDAVRPSAEQAQSDRHIAAPARWQELRAV